MSATKTKSMSTDTGGAEVIDFPSPSEARVRVEAEPRPEIEISTEIAENIDAALAVLLRDDLDVYVGAAGRLVSVGRVSAAEAAANSYEVTRDGETVRVFRVLEGTPNVSPLEKASICDRLSRVAQFMRHDRTRDTWVPARPPREVVEGLACRRSFPGGRHLVGIIETPSMRPDCSIIDRHGFDAATGFVYSPSPDMRTVKIKARPTQEDAARALGELLEVFQDFPFPTSAGRCAAVAAALTIIARPAIVGSVPAFMFDATTRGSGKSLCADAVSAIATGRGVPRGTFPASADELEKVLAGYAMRSAAVVAFDNLVTGFGGAPLDRVLSLEEGGTSFRVLGTNTQPTMPWSAVILASGNNMSVFGDCERRVLVARMETDLERPEDRPAASFAHVPLVPWIRSQRTRLVRAALTLLRAHAVNGGKGPTWGGFQSWADLVAGAIIFAGGSNVLDCKVSTEAGEDGSRAATEAFLANLGRLDPDRRGLTVKNVLETLYPPTRDRRETLPEAPGFSELRDAVEALVPTREGSSPDARALGKIFHSLKGRNFGGRKLTGRAGGGGILKWTVTSIAP